MATADPSSPQQARRAKAQALAAQRHLASPVARGQRHRSRTQFSGLSSGAALRVDRAVPGSALRARTPRPLQAARKQGLKVASFSTPYAAVLRPVSGTKGPGVMAMSSLPMRARDSAGQLRLVDLSVLPAAGGFVADNPRVALSIGSRSRDGVRVSDQDVSITPLDVNDVPGIRSGEAVAFLGTGRDSDHIVQVTPAGVDSQVSIRSAAASSRYRYRIDLPAGGSLHQLADDSISVRQNGRRVGMITTPTAWDADHRGIPVTSSLVGRVLTLDVGLEGRDVRFPATLDPNYVDILQYSWYTGGRNSLGEPNPRYWSFSTNAPAAMSGLFGNYANGASGQTQGLYAGTKGNQATYAGYNAYWHFTAPGTTSVLQAEWTHLSQIFTYAVGPPPCIDFGLTTTSGTWGTLGRECGNQFTPGYRLSCIDCNPDDGFDYRPDINGAQFGAYVPVNTFSNISDYLGESTLYLADADDPTVTLTSQPTPGWSDNPVGTIAANSSDPGLGVFSMSIDGAGTTNNTNCLSAGPCPGSMSTSTSVAALNVADGTNTVNVTARDGSYFSARNTAAQHIRTVPTTIRRDRGNPVITPSGTLNAARNGFIGADQDAVLNVTATDGDLSSPAAQRSGVTSLTATLDDQPMTGGSTGSVPCSRPEGSCALSINAALTASEIQALDDTVAHTIKITATDALGHTTIDSYTFHVDAVAPTSFSDGGLAQLSGRTLTENSYSLRVEARDNQPFQPEMDDSSDISPPVFEQPGAGLRDLVIRLDGQPVSTTATACFDDPQCEDARVWQWDTTSIANGTHTVTITAADKVGNLDVDTFQVDLQRAPDQPARTDSTIRRTVLGAGVGDRAGAATTALGDVNGDGFADYAIGSPNATPLGRSAAGTASLILGSADASTIDLSSPGTAARTISGPGTNQYCGTSVAAAGDINGDGLADMLVGCPGLDSQLGGVSATGRVYVVFGSSDPQNVDLSNLGSAGFVITGPTDTLDLGFPLLASRPAVFGERLQSAPLDQTTQDVNDDGLADIVIGDSAVKRGAQNATGATYVVYGKADSQPVDATALGTGGYVIRGVTSDSMSGYSATIAGDLDGDTIADIVIGAPGQKPTTGGRAYIVKGAPYSADGSRTNTDIDLDGTSGRVTTLTSADASDRFGVNVAALGDTNLDDSPDIAIATSSGAYVLRTIPTASRQVSADDGYRVTGPTNQPGLLSTQVPAAPISAAGDLEGDERADLIIGYPDTAGARAYTVRSPETTRTINVTSLRGQRGAAITNGTQSELSGAAVAANSYQGTTPVSENAQAIVGAPNAAADTLRPSAGRAYVLSEPVPAGPGVDAPQPPTDVSTPSGPSTTTTSTSSTTGPQARAAASPLAREPFRQNVPGLFHIQVFSAFNTRWSTVRNDLQLFVIGSGAENQPFYVDDQKRTFRGASGTNVRKVYLHGRLDGGVQRCGWVIGDNAPGDGEKFPASGSPRPPCSKKQRLAPRAFASLINCDWCNDGAPVRLRRRDGGDLPAQIPIYRNVHPGTREGRFSPDGTIPTTLGGNIVKVNWRYITKSGKFVLARANSDNATNAQLFGNNKWVFIERKYLPHTAGRGGLCDNTDTGLPRFESPGPRDDPGPGEFLNFNSEPAANKQSSPQRLKRNDWPRVCSHRFYRAPDNDGL